MGVDIITSTIFNDIMIRTSGLTKYYGKFPALVDFTMEIKKGEVVGLLGLNGAGKTTCMRILTGYLLPTEGEVTIDDLNLFGNPFEVRSRLGYLPEQPPLYPELTVQDYLRFVGRLRGLPEEDFEEEFKRVSEITRIEPARRSLIRNLSHGYRKRVGIAQALLASPSVLILDEPVSGLDPRQVVEMRKLIRNLAGKHTILISSHLLYEVSRTCDRVLIIHKGGLVGDFGGEEMEKNLEEKFMELTGSPVTEVGI